MYACNSHTTGSASCACTFANADNASCACACIYSADTSNASVSKSFDRKKKASKSFVKVIYSKDGTAHARKILNIRMNDEMRNSNNSINNDGIHTCVALLHVYSVISNLNLRDIYDVNYAFYI